MLACVRPQSHSNAGRVAVRTKLGFSPAGPASQFTYAAIPAVAHLTPSSGPAAGGTSVVIGGQGFTGATTVAFGDVVSPGEFCLLASLSGQGKSTFLRAASGLVPHFHGGRFAGTVTVAGLDTREHGPAVEVYCSHRYFTVTEQLWPGKPDSFALLDWPTLEQRAGRARRNGMSAMARGQDVGRGQRFRGRWRAAPSSKPAQVGLICAGLGSHKYLKLLNSFTLGGSCKIAPPN